MLERIISNHIRKCISEFTEGKTLTNEDKKALYFISSYAQRHYVIKRDYELSALQSIIDAIYYLSTSGINNELSIVSQLSDYCIKEMSRINRTYEKKTSAVANKENNSFNTKATSQTDIKDIRKSFKWFIFISLSVIIICAFLNENNKKNKARFISVVPEYKQNNITHKNRKRDSAMVIEDNKDNSVVISHNTSVSLSYKETFYNTGESPYKKWYGKGIYDYNSLSYLNVTNYSSNDAVLLLVHKSKGVVRNVYIAQDHSYKIKYIPEGKYIVKVMYGNSWNSEKQNGLNFPKGGFMENANFEQTKWDDPFVFLFKEDSEGINYPTYTLTLHKVKYGNLHTDKIKPDEFWVE